MSKRNIKLTVEYNGKDFHGFQYQTDFRTVQGEIEKALLKLTSKEHQVFVAGRTDKGVHAAGQVCSFFTESRINLISFLDGLNRFLPEDIAIKKVEQVSDNFNARFSAKGRHYEYYLVNRRMKYALDEGRMTVIKDPLDVEKMKEALKVLVGEHDFSSFRAAACQAKSPVTELYKAELEEYEKYGDKFIKVTFHGRAFLHNMIRIIMGTLVDIGRGYQPLEYMQNALEAKKRSAAGPTLKPDGLTFTGVDYCDDYEVFESVPK